jgi:hypothetical protein
MARDLLFEVVGKERRKRRACQRVDSEGSLQVRNEGDVLTRVVASEEVTLVAQVAHRLHDRIQIGGADALGEDAACFHQLGIQHHLRQVQLHAPSSEPPLWEIQFAPLRIDW